MTSNDWVTSLTVIGALILFISWICENYFQKKWEGQKQEQDKMRLELSRCEDRNLLTVSLTDLFKSIHEKEKTEESLGMYCKMLCRFVKNLLTMQMYTADILSIDNKTYDKSYPLKVRQNLFEKEKLINEYTETNNLKGLAETVNLVSAEMYTHNDDAINIANTYLKNLNDKISFFNKVFLVCYIMGSIFLGFAFLVDYINKS
jgi:hypothetical protein